MAKAKEKKDGLELSGMKAKDLSLEKRVELATNEFDKFQELIKHQFGMSLGAELSGYPRAIVARLTLIDLLKKDENKEQPKENNKQK